MSKQKIGVIVDGYTEVEAFKKCFDSTRHDFHIIRNGCNGKNVSLDRIANTAAKSLAAISKRGTTLNLLIVDREDRQSLSANEMRIQLETKISTIFTGHVAVFIPDQMFENWIAADFNNLKGKHPNLIKPTAISSSTNEGRNGVTVLKENWKNESVYKKAIHGPLLFKSINKEIAMRHSISFKSFIEFLRANRIKIH